MTDTNTMVLITGDGKTAFSRSDIARATLGYKKQYQNVVVVHADEPDFSLEKLEKQLKIEKDKSIDVCIYAHGIPTANGLNFNFSENRNVPCREIFDVISKTTNKPINMYILSCHGGGALEPECINHLPKGSKAFSCCDYSSSLPGADVERFVHTLNAKKLEDNGFDSILMTYCSSMKNRNSIVIGGTEQQPTDLLRKMIATTGRKLSEEEKSLVKEKLTPYFDEKLLNTVIDKFASSGEYNMYAVEVGCAMAITHQISNSLGGKRTNDFDKGKPTYYRR